MSKEILYDIDDIFLELRDSDGRFHIIKEFSEEFRMCHIFIVKGILNISENGQIFLVKDIKEELLRFSDYLKINNITENSCSIRTPVGNWITRIQTGDIKIRDLFDYPLSEKVVERIYIRIEI
jgi:hypothetical protein